MSTNPTDEIEAALAAGPLRCEGCDSGFPGTHDWCSRVEAVAAFIAEREAGLRASLDTTTQRWAERARDISSALGIADESTTRQIEAIDALRAQADKRGEESK